jgi:hypothetical protein
MDWCIKPQEVWATGKLKLRFHLGDAGSELSGSHVYLDVTDGTGATRRVRFRRDGEAAEVRTLTYDMFGRKV